MAKIDQIEKEMDGKKQPGKKQPKERKKYTGPAKFIKEGHTLKRFSVQFDIFYGGSPGKNMDPESLTVPDMNLTIRQLMENHTRGKGNTVAVKQPVYFDYTIPQIKDITDIHEFKKQLEDQLNNVEEFIQNDLKKGADKKEKEAAEKAEKEKEMEMYDEFKKNAKKGGKQLKIDDNA